MIEVYVVIDRLLEDLSRRRRSLCSIYANTWCALGMGEGVGGGGGETSSTPAHQVAHTHTCHAVGEFVMTPNKSDVVEL